MSEPTKSNVPRSRFPLGAEKPHITKMGHVWAVQYGRCGGVFPTFAAACGAARYYARYPEYAT